MFKLATMTLLLLLNSSGYAADDIEPLDGAFLVYLANMEGDEDDWTLLAEASEAPPATQDEDSSAKPEKTSKEPAAPAVDER